MTRKERFITAAKRGKPDRVPVFANLTPQIAKILGEQYNLPVEPEDSFLSTRISHTEILIKLGNDAVGIGACRQKDRPTVELGAGRVKDEWGIIYEQCGLYMEPVVRPLAFVESVEDLEQYSMPDPYGEGRFDLAEDMVSTYGQEYAIVGDHEATLFELAWGLVGMEKFLMDLYSGEEYINVLLDKLMDYNMKIGIRLVELGSDMIWMGDDLGTQISMMISPDLYRQYIKPRQAKMIQAFKEANPNVIIAYHSCGSILSIIDDLIEVGVEVLNPIQPQALGMDLAEIKRKYGDKLAFFGAIDVQGVLPKGTAEDVKQEVKFRIEQGGRNGGLILAPAHNIQPDTPVENILAMYEAVQESGKY